MIRYSIETRERRVNALHWDRVPRALSRCCDGNTYISVHNFTTLTSGSYSSPSNSLPQIIRLLLRDLPGAIKPGGVALLFHLGQEHKKDILVEKYRFGPA